MEGGHRFVVVVATVVVVVSRPVMLTDHGTVDQVEIDSHLDPADLDPARTRVLLGPLARRPGGARQVSGRVHVLPVVPQRDPQALRLGQPVSVDPAGGLQVDDRGVGAGVHARQVTPGVEPPGPGVQERQHRGRATALGAVIGLHVVVER